MGSPRRCAPNSLADFSTKPNIGIYWYFFEIRILPKVINFKIDIYDTINIRDQM